MGGECRNVEILLVSQNYQEAYSVFLTAKNGSLKLTFGVLVEEDCFREDTKVRCGWQVDAGGA